MSTAKDAEQASEKPDELTQRDSGESNREPGESEGFTEPLAEVLKDAPEPLRHRVETFLAASRSLGPPQNPVLSKVTSEHIDTVLGIHKDLTQYEHEEQIAQRRYGIVLLLDHYRPRGPGSDSVWRDQAKSNFAYRCPGSNPRIGRRIRGRVLSRSTCTKNVT